MMYLISYDIQNDYLRIKIARLILRYGLYRLQYSVFMGQASTKAIETLKQALLLFPQDPNWTSEDSLLLLPLHEYSMQYLTLLGTPPKDWSLIQQNVHTLII